MTRERNKKRAEDTREKIQLGGLIIKAGLDDLGSTELLGALIEIGQMLQSKDGELHSRRFTRTGRAIFESDERKKLDAKNGHL